MKAKLVRTGKPITPVCAAILLRQDRAIADKVCRPTWAHSNHGTLRIGDTLSGGRADRVSRCSRLCPRAHGAASRSVMR